MADKGTTLTARLLATLDGVIDSVNTKIGTNTDAAGTTTVFARLAQIYDAVTSIITKLSGDENTGIHVHANNIIEQDVLELAGTDRLKIDGIWLDMFNLTQNANIKVYHKIDGTNYRQYDEFNWFTSDDDGIFIAGVTINNDWKITLTSLILEGVSRNVPYNLIKTEME